MLKRKPGKREISLLGLKLNAMNLLADQPII